MLMKSILVGFVFATTVSVAQRATPSIPAGVWQNKEEGFVVRVESCGGGFCGVAVGAPKNGKHKPEEICGKTLLKDFLWNGNSHKWVGHMQPPDMDRALNSEVETDGMTYMKVHAHILMMSKTLNFQPYTGRLGDHCELE